MFFEPYLPSSTGRDLGTKRKLAVRKQIQSVLASGYRGPKAGYGEVDVLKAMFAIGKSENKLGRFKLGQIVGLGQGEVRTLISRLKENDLITVDSRGCALTEKGVREFYLISKAIPFSSQVDARGLDLGGKFTWAIIVRDKEARVKKGLEQRDAAIRAGATGAFTVIYSSERFEIPSADDRPSDCEAMGPSEPWTTIRNGKPRDGDVVIVSGADNATLAEEGALSAALTIL